jgi:type IV pilus assembly protein PilZ
MNDPRDDRGPMAGRRADERVEVSWAVDCRSEEVFLYAYITNVSAMGLFVRTESPLPVGTRLRLCFAPDGADAFDLVGEVAWVNAQPPSRTPNPGMGIRFVGLAADERERLVEAIHTIAYVRSPSEAPSRRSSPPDEST